MLDDEERLVGVVPTRRLLLNDLEQKVADIMVQPVIALADDATVLDACEFFTLHRLLALPIVDGQRRLRGVIDVELYTEELTGLEEKAQSDDLFQLIGVHVSQARQGSAWQAFRVRFPWLTCNLTAGILCAFLLGFFEHELAQAVQLALFVPVVLALAESVSIQSATLALQALHGGRPRLAVMLETLRRELAIGLLLGGALRLDGRPRGPGLAGPGTNRAVRGTGHHRGGGFRRALRTVGAVSAALAPAQTRRWPPARLPWRWPT